MIKANWERRKIHTCHKWNKHLRFRSRVLKRGDSVFFDCYNPSTGVIKRMARDKSWADVEWFNGSNKYTSRTDTKCLLHLCTALNYFVQYPF